MRDLLILLCRASIDRSVSRHQRASVTTASASSIGDAASHIRSGVEDPPGAPSSLPAAVAAGGATAAGVDDSGALGAASGALAFFGAFGFDSAAGLLADAAGFAGAGGNDGRVSDRIAYSCESDANSSIARQASGSQSVTDNLER